MAKEIIDKETGVKNKKNGSSAQLKNTLSANSPEEEYLASCETKIEEIKDKIKGNEEILDQERESLSDGEDVFNSFCIQKLSEFLSEDELEIIKSGREYSELVDTLKKGDNLGDLVEKICKGLQNFSDEEKLILARYLQNKNILLLGMGGNDTLGFYYRDFPDEIVFANEVERNIIKLGIDKFVKYVGDSCYRADYDLLLKIKKRIIKEYSSQGEQEKHSRIDGLTSECKELERELEDIEERKAAVEKFGLPEIEALNLYQWSENLEGHERSFLYDKENHVCVVLNDYSHHSLTGGSEYGTTISIKRGKNETQKSFKYRDPFDGKKDQPWLDYQTIECINVNGDKVEVTVSSRESSDTYTFDIAYEEVKRKSRVSASEKKEFEESIQPVIDKLIDTNTIKRNYPASYNFSLRQIPGAFSNEGMDLESELPFEEAKIIYKDVRPKEGIAHITVLKHCDATGDMGRQYGLIQYIVSPEGVENVGEYFYWEQQLKDGDIDKNKLEEFKRW